MKPLNLDPVAEAVRQIAHDKGSDFALVASMVVNELSIERLFERVEDADLRQAMGLICQSQVRAVAEFLKIDLQAAIIIGNSILEISDNCCIEHLDPMDHEIVSKTLQQIFGKE